MKRGKLVLMLFVFSFLFNSQFLAQEEIENDHYMPNAIYIEFLGNAPWFSLNYDRMINENFSFRVGLGYFISESRFLWCKTEAKTEALTSPLMFNYVSGSLNSKLEVGIGVLFISASELNVGSPFISTHDDKNQFKLTSTIAYRYQPIDGGIFFKIGFTPIVGSKEIIPFFGISIGGVFR